MRGFRFRLRAPIIKSTATHAPPVFRHSVVGDAVVDLPRNLLESHLPAVTGSWAVPLLTAALLLGRSRHGCAMILQRISVRSLRARHACDATLFSILVLSAGIRYARGVTMSSITAHQMANVVLYVLVGERVLADECLKPLRFKSGVFCMSSGMRSSLS